MNLIPYLKELWRRRLLVVLAAAAAVAISLIAIYDVSFAPPSISKRTEVNAQGSIEILVDSSQSPIADVGSKLTPLTDRAGVFARYIAGGNVIARIAKQTGIPVKQIDVVGPASLPGEAPGASEAGPQLRPYGIAIAQRESLPIVHVSTRAPTVREARDLAAAAPTAIRSVVESIQEQQQIPLDKRVEFEALGPAQAAPVASALGAKIALVLFLFLLGAFVIAILGIPRFRAAWRAAEKEPEVQAEHRQDEPEDVEAETSAPAVLHVPHDSAVPHEPAGDTSAVRRFMSQDRG